MRAEPNIEIPYLEGCACPTRADLYAVDTERFDRLLRLLGQCKSLKRGYAKGCLGCLERTEMYQKRQEVKITMGADESFHLKK